MFLPQYNQQRQAGWSNCDKLELYMSIPHRLFLSELGESVSVKPSKRVRKNVNFLLPQINFHFFFLYPMMTTRWGLMGIPTTCLGRSPQRASGNSGSEFLNCPHKVFPRAPPNIEGCMRHAARFQMVADLDIWEEIWNLEEAAGFRDGSPQ